ncbi:SDR family oxidoreductase [Legionella sp. W05-934-2]|uniref:SDR family oxidoreductase n=1 Tax=Legionella sp. W05-934-2 TaxID=1198649 RepID=UPI003461C6D2
MFNLTNKSVIITGGAGILGQAFTKSLSDAGAKVAIVDINPTSLDETAHILYQHNPDAEILPIPCDITNKDSIEKMVQLVKNEFGQINVLFNNAATKTSNLKNFFDPFEEYKLETWKEVMSVNIDAMFLVAQAVGKVLIKQNSGGSIIQTSSIYGIVAPDQSIYEGSEYMGVAINTPAVYSASKGAVISFTNYLATYWAKHNIRVNAITPGGMESGQNDTFKNNYAKKVPLGRMGHASELMGALIFLASDASSYITGQNIIVDGGFTCW